MVTTTETRELVLATFTALFTVVNPFGAMPVFITLTQDDTAANRNQQALRACIYMALILSVFFVAGQYVLNFFGIGLTDIRIAGGLMIMRAGFGLLTSKAHQGKKVSKSVLKESLEKDDISFTPLAMPMLSGPGSIAVSIGMFSPALSYSGISLILVSIALVAAVTFVILVFSHQLVSYMGKAGLSALSRIMGFIVLSIGVNFVTTGILSLLGK